MSRPVLHTHVVHRYAGGIGSIKTAPDGSRVATAVHYRDVVEINVLDGGLVAAHVTARFRTDETGVIEQWDRLPERRSTLPTRAELLETIAAMAGERAANA
jgi:hypothetical protein